MFGRKQGTDQATAITVVQAATRLAELQVELVRIARERTQIQNDRDAIVPRDAANEVARQAVTLEIIDLLGALLKTLRGKA